MNLFKRHHGNAGLPECYLRWNATHRAAVRKVRLAESKDRIFHMLTGAAIGATALALVACGPTEPEHPQPVAKPEAINLHLRGWA